MSVDAALSLREHITALLGEMDRRYSERFDAQTKALDAAFLAQQTAVQAALANQEKATQAAMVASEKAIAKAEASTHERLTLLNELRGDVATRGEFQALLTAFSDLKERIDKLEGKSIGANAIWGYALGAAGLIASVAAVTVIVMNGAK